MQGTPTATTQVLIDVDATFGYPTTVPVLRFSQLPVISFRAPFHNTVSRSTYAQFQKCYRAEKIFDVSFRVV